MATATTSPSNVPDPFDLGDHTPANLARGARAALLRNSSAAAHSPIGIPPRFARATHTPSSPLLNTFSAAAVEGAQRHNRYDTPEIPSLTQVEPVSVLEQANKLEREQVEAYQIKVAKFRDDYHLATYFGMERLEEVLGAIS